MKEREMTWVASRSLRFMFTKIDDLVLYDCGSGCGPAFVWAGG